MACSRAHQTPIEQLLSQPDSPECAEFLSHCEGCAECAAELAAHRGRNLRGGSRGLVLGLIAGAIALAAIFVWSGDRESPIRESAETVRTTDRPTPVVEPPTSDPAPRDPERDRSGELVSGETRQISLADHPAGQPIQLDLRLVEPSDTDEARPVRLLSSAGESLEIAGALSDDRTTASIEVPRNYLAPGRYMVEVRTTEKSALPLRRYVIDVQ